MRVELGQQVKDRVSGFKGTAVARTEWLNGCARIGIQPPIDSKGSLPSMEMFDEQQIETLGTKKVKLNKSEETGGPLPVAVLRR